MNTGPAGVSPASATQVCSRVWQDVRQPPRPAVRVWNSSAKADLGGRITQVGSPAAGIQAWLSSACARTRLRRGRCRQFSVTESRREAFDLPRKSRADDAEGAQRERAAAGRSRKSPSRHHGAATLAQRPAWYARRITERGRDACSAHHCRYRSSPVYSAPPLDAAAPIQRRHRRIARKPPSRSTSFGS